MKRSIWRIVGVASGVLTLALADTGCIEGAEDAASRVSHLPREELRDSAAAKFFTSHAPGRETHARVRDTLRLVRVIGDTSQLIRVSSLMETGPYLLITDRKASPHLALLDPKSGKLLWRFGEHGSGANQFFDPIVVGTSRQAPQGVWVYDFQNARLSELQLGRTADPVVTRSITLPYARRRPLTPAVLGDHIVTNGLFVDYVLLLYDLAGHPIKKLGVPPYTDSLSAFQLNISSLAAAPDGSRFAVAYQHASRLDLFTSAGARYGSLAGPRAIRTSFRTDTARRYFHWKDDNEQAFIAVAATDSLVYALFCGCTNAGEASDRYIEVYRWNGTLVNEYATSRTLVGLSVSRDGKFLYGLLADSLTGRVPRIGVWQLGSANGQRAQLSNGRQHLATGMGLR